MGAERVIISDLVDERLRLAQKLGADEIINAKQEDPVEKVRQLTNGYGADVVIEAIGLPATWEQALLKRLLRMFKILLEEGPKH